jgi:hypothetical protein
MEGAIVMAAAPSDGISWLPLEAALTWITTRDPRLTKSVVRSWNSIQIGDVAKVPFIQGNQSAQLEKAWLELRTRVAHGDVRARGRRAVDELPRSDRHWTLAEECQELTNVLSLLPSGAERIALHANTYPLIDCVPWRGVIIAQDDLLLAFPPAGQSTTGDPIRPARDYKTRSVKDALSSLVGPGSKLPDWSEDEAFDAVNKWLDDHRRKPVSRSVFKNVWQSLPTG